LPNPIIRRERMKKRRFRMQFVVCLVTLVLIAGLAGACGKQATEPTTQAPTTSAPTTQTPETTQVIELIAHAPTPPTANPSKVMDEFLNKFEEASGGRVKFVRYYSAALFEPREVIQSVLTGVADIHFSQVPQAEPGLMALNCYLLLPYIGWDSCEQATAVHRELLDSFKALRDEYQGLKVLYPTIYSTGGYLNTKKLVENREDLQGMKIQADSWAAKCVDLVGGTSVYIPWADRYTSFERGLVDGCLGGGFDAINALGALDLFTYHTRLLAGFSSGFDATVMNPDSFNRLPSDIQRIFDDLEPWYTARRIAVETEANERFIQQMKESGLHTFVDFSPEEGQVWKDAAKVLHEQWITDAEALGKPGRAFYEELQRLIKESK
jgi:TRAP-type C4-dicarboxylate transport system substrate-binding protein